MIWHVQWEAVQGESFELLSVLGDSLDGRFTELWGI